MNRRSFLSFIGLAPVAASLPATALAQPLMAVGEFSDADLISAGYVLWSEDKESESKYWIKPLTGLPCHGFDGIR